MLEHLRLARVPCRFGVALGLLLSLASSVHSQGITTATIRGKVLDDTGGALPGVSVTITSPSLIGGTLERVSDAQGDYTFPDLAIGEYKMTFELSGFQRLVRDQVHLTAGFSATVNVAMKIGAVEESITVQGAGPVVDVTNTTAKTSLSAQALTENIPVERNYKDVVMTAPGIGASKADLIGGAQGGTSTSYGLSGQLTSMREGINQTQGTANVGISPDMASMEEFQVVTVAGSAEQSSPGTFVNIILKSGGNQFHGRFEENGSHSNLVGNNITPALAAQGLKSAGLQFENEITGDLGGRVIKDKLWFYVSGRYVRDDLDPFGLWVAPSVSVYSPTISSVQGTQTNEMDNQTAKLTYQAARNYKLIAAYARDRYTTFPQTVAPTVPLQSTQWMTNDPHMYKVELQGTPSDRLLFNVLAGENSYLAQYEQAPGSPNVPSSMDLTTQITSGPTTNLLHRPRDQKEFVGSVSFFPEKELLGKHELKGGFQYSYQSEGAGQLAVPHGNYLLLFDTINGVPHQPYEIETFNYPVAPVSQLAQGGAYVQDTWRMTNRLSVNLGLRLDSFRTFDPPQVKVQGQFGTSGSLPYLATGSWRPWAPRLAAAYQLTSDGKTVVKSTWGRYNNSPSDCYAATYNQNTTTTTTYKWHDLNGNGDYDPGEVNLNTNGPDFVSITSAANNIINQSLKNPYTLESTATLEHELLPNLGVKLMFVYIKQDDLICSSVSCGAAATPVNILRPYNTWNVVVPLKDPGPDGIIGTADDGGIINVYDYAPAYKGSNFVEYESMNADSAHDPTFKTIEFTLNKRMSNKWSLLASAYGTQTHSWSVLVPQSPNDNFNNEYTYWDRLAKLTGTYELPAGIAVSSAFSLESGVVGQNTYLFRGLPQSGTITMRLNPLGAERGPIRSMTNFRVAKDFKTKFGKIRGYVDLLNVFNNSSQWAISYLEGPTYGQPSSIDEPRFIHIGASFTF